MRIIRTMLLSITCIVFMQVNAQTSIAPFDATINFNEAERPCIQVNLDPESKNLKEAWRDYLKDNYDFKLKGIGFLSNKDLLSAEAVIVNQISSKTMDFYTHIVEDDNGSEMKVFVRLGYDIYVTNQNYPNEYAAINEIIESFIKYYLPKYYEEEINETEKRVNELTDEKNDLKKKIEEKANDIEKLRTEINEEEEELKAKRGQLEETEGKLAKRKEKLERIRVQLRQL